MDRVWESTFREVGVPELIAGWERAKERDHADPAGMHRLRFIDRYRSGAWARAYHARKRAEHRTDPGAEGRLIRSERTQAGLSLRGLARRAGVSRSALSRIERGSVTLSFATAVAIADALGVELDVLSPARAR